MTSPSDLRALILCLKTRRGAPTRCVGLPRRLGVSRFRAVRQVPLSCVLLRRALFSAATTLRKRGEGVCTPIKRRRIKNRGLGLVGSGWVYTCMGQERFARGALAAFGQVASRAPYLLLGCRPIRKLDAGD